MSSILLRSESGKWKRETTTDDKLFSPILGAMVEEGIDLGKELVIEGALGEELDEKWWCIELLEEWIMWEAMCLDVSSRDVLQHLEELGGQSDWGRVTKNGVRKIEYADNVITIGPHANLYVKELRPPQKVLWRQDIAILSNALSLPDGWELHVAVDERTSLIERRHHLQSSLNYLRKNAASALRRGGGAFTGVNFCVYDEKRVMDDREVVNGSLFDALGRNCLLIEFDALLKDNRDTSSFPNLTTNIMVDRMDWHILREMTEGNETIEGKAVYSAADYMLGGTSEGRSWITDVSRRIEGISMDNYYSHPEECDRMARLYEKLLTILPEDSKYMGIESILGTDTERQSWGTKRVNEIVGWIHYYALTYLQWLRTYDVHAARQTDKRGWEKLPIARCDFPEIVAFLGKTLGLRSLRRILLSLLYYLVENADKARNPRKSKKPVSRKTQEKRDKHLQAVERAELFAELIEKYLEEHEGEDEGVKTFKLGETEEAKKARKYYM
jgi:hypothetical protein